MQFPRSIREWPCLKSDVNICAKVSAVLFQLPRKLGDCGESVHAVDVNICRTPSSSVTNVAKSDFANEEQNHCRFERAKEARVHILIFPAFVIRRICLHVTFTRISAIRPKSRRTLIKTSQRKTVRSYGSRLLCGFSFKHRTRIAG